MNALSIIQCFGNTTNPWTPTGCRIVCKVQPNVSRTHTGNLILPWTEAANKTCSRWLKQWVARGVFQNIHRHLLTELNATAELKTAGRLDLADVLVDASLIKAPLGGQKPARTRPIGAAWAPSRT